MYYREFRAMNTDILLAAEGSPEDVEAGFAQAEAFIHSSEARFTRFSELSELSQLNRAAGDWFEASPDLYLVVFQAMEYYQRTGGLFDPSVLAALQYAGYDRSMDEIKQRNNLPAPLGVYQKPPSFEKTLFDPVRQRIKLPQGLAIDLGGIAKGWIAEKAAHILANYSSACAVDAGGDASFVGEPEKTKTWRIALENPGNSNRALAILKTGPGAIATSAVTKRRWQQGGQSMHHLIDPRTHRPANTDWNSVTVIAPHATQAEVYAKSILIGGPAEVMQIASTTPEIEFIVVDQQNRLWGSKHSREYIDEQN